MEQENKIDMSAMMLGYILASMFSAFGSIGSAVGLLSSGLKIEDIFPKDALDECHRLCEGKSHEEQKEIFERMREEDPRIKAVFDRLNDKDGMAKLSKLQEPIDKEMESLMAQKMDLLKKYVKGEL